MVSTVDRGATRADTVAEAVAASQLVIVCVIDYAAAMAVLAPAAEALRGRTVVNLTADTPERAREAAGWAAAHGIDYLDGAVMTPTTNRPWRGRLLPADRGITATDRRGRPGSGAAGPAQLSLWSTA